MAFTDPIPARQVSAAKRKNPATDAIEVCIRSLTEPAAPDAAAPMPGLVTGGWQDAAVWVTLDDAAKLRDKLTELLGG